jgi:hypothetical protein
VTTAQRQALAFALIQRLAEIVHANVTDLNAKHACDEIALLAQDAWAEADAAARCTTEPTDPDAPDRQ